MTIYTLTKINNNGDYRLGAASPVKGKTVTTRVRSNSRRNASKVEMSGKPKPRRSAKNLRNSCRRLTKRCNHK